MLLIIVAAGCGGAEDIPQPLVTSDSTLSYTFDSPTRTVRLPTELKEISGIAILDEHHVVAVQDEEGILFVVDLQTGNPVEQWKFGGRRDYEDLVLLNDTVYVIESDGTLYEVTGWRGPNATTREIDTGLSSRYDTEGLAYDAGRLFIGCKEYPGDNLEGYRAVYAFDVAAERLIEKPAYLLSIEEMAPYARAAQPRDLEGKLRALIEGRLYEFGIQPSALAFHPITGELYVLSAETKAIAVLGRDGRLRHVHLLPQALFRQPEGMAFYPNGDLLISNEINVGPATIHLFTYRREAAPKVKTESQKATG
jgi:hypothetical protein